MGIMTELNEQHVLLECLILKRNNNPRVPYSAQDQFNFDADPDPDPGSALGKNGSGSRSFL